MFPLRMSAGFWALGLGIGLSGMAAAQPEARDTQARSGSTAFCLYELPGEGNGRKRLINLAIVQYVETTRNELRIVFGGGNFGSGYEAVIPLASPDEASAQLQKIMDSAKACR